MKSRSQIARILICDDSRTFAHGLKRFLETDPDLRVIAICETGEEAVAEVGRVKPDLVTMDLALPEQDGVSTIGQIMRARPVPILVLSAFGGRGSPLAAAALGAGALDAQHKREIQVNDPLTARSVAFRRRVRRLALTGVRGAKTARRTPAAHRVNGRAAAVIGISASTGGPPALKAVLGALPTDFPIPVLLVQHITSGFLPGLVDWLQQQVGIPVRIARDEAPLTPGAWFAPDDAHLVIGGGFRTHFDGSTVAGYHRPAADVLFSSMAAAAAERAVTVVLTGMGSDGAEGTALVQAAGGLTIAQDERTAAVQGMPRAAAEQGAELILPLPEIGPALCSLARAGVKR